MDRFPRLRRHKKDAAAASGSGTSPSQPQADAKTAPAAAAATAAAARPRPATSAGPASRPAASLAPGPGADAGAGSGPGPGPAAGPRGELSPSAMPRQRQRISPSRFFNFHRSSSGKRSRESPPASLPQSPITAVTPHHSSFNEAAIAGHRPVSPESMRKDLGSGDGPVTRQGGEHTRPVKMPAFLEQSKDDIDAKFQELTWLERYRIQQSMTNASPDFRFARVTGSHLKTLDRYMNIQPWDNNRVKLQVPAGNVDYINASPIVLTPATSSSASGAPAEITRESDRYIAMQGPKQATTDHVWRMIAEQLESPGVIVMLTDTHEAGMEKCFQYFPRYPGDPPMEVNEQDEFGDGFRATVRCVGMEETPVGDAIELRKLVMTIHGWGKDGKANGSAGAGGQHQNGARMLDVATPEPEGITSDDEEQDHMVLSPIRKGLDDPNPLTHTPNGSTMPQRQPPQLIIDETHEQLPAPAVPMDEDKEEHGGQGASNGHTRIDDSKNGGKDEERIVWHFLYKKWPDFGVPAIDDLDSFFTLMRLSRERNAHPNNPRIVHCSAGVGRSGTFITLEHLSRELDAGVLEHWDERQRAAKAASNSSGGGGGGRSPNRSRQPSPAVSARGGGSDSPDHHQQQNGNGGGISGIGHKLLRSSSSHGNLRAPGSGKSSRSGSRLGTPSVDGGSVEEVEGQDLIFTTVNALREQRRTMVQAESQYMFVYQVMRKLWQDKYGAPGQDDGGEPAAKRLEVDPFVEPRMAG